jgi:hypothetical protein
MLDNQLGAALVPVPLLIWRYWSFDLDDDIKSSYGSLVLIEEELEAPYNAIDRLKADTSDNFPLWKQYEGEFPKPPHQYQASMFIDHFYAGTPRYEIFGNRAHRVRDVLVALVAAMVCFCVGAYVVTHFLPSSLPIAILDIALCVSVLHLVYHGIWRRDRLPRLSQEQINREFDGIRKKIDDSEGKVPYVRS